jgi:hypothetical protein
MAAQQSGMMPPGQQPLPQEMPQAPAGPPPGLQGQSLPGPQPPANPNLVDSTQQQPVGMSTNAKGSAGGQVLMANGGFVEKFTDDQYNKFSSHFPFSKEQRGSIAHNATVEHPDLTMVRPKKYVFGGLKHALGGFKYDNGGPYKPYVAENKGPYQPDPGYLGHDATIVRGVKREKYDPVSENIYINSSYDDPLDEQEAINHETMHHLQKRLGALSSTEKWPGPLKTPSIVATGNQVHDYYNRNREDLNNIVNALPQSSLTGIPRDMLLKGFQGNLYDTPGTAEYEADHPIQTIDQWKLNARRENEEAAGPVRFAIGGFEGDPKKKGDIATAADSSYVAAGANAPYNFYTKNNYEVRPNYNNSVNNIFKELKFARDNYSGFDAVKVGSTNGEKLPYKDYTNYKSGNHRFEQRETAVGIVNDKAPRSKYDDRISPQKVTTYSNYDSGDVASVPTYDKLAVTPWGELSDKQKIKRLQQYGGSGTPYKDKTSIKKAIQELKIPKPVEPPVETLKMIEAKPLPLPTIDIKPQLQNIPNISKPYPPKPETEYFIMPSGNPGVGVIHGRTYDGKGGYKEKVIGPSLARDWFNNEDQKAFDTRDMSSRVDYDPRDKDPDHKIYADMYSAIQEIEKLRQQEKEAQKPKKTPQVRIIKTPKFATGGYKLLKKRR